MSSATTGHGSPGPGGRLVSVNLGHTRSVTWRERSVSTAIWKQPTDRPVLVGRDQLAGDSQADLTVHGGRDKAVYAYASEDYAWWERELGHDLEIAMLGENLTTVGVEVTRAVIGERWHIGTAVLEVAQPRFPCYKLGIRMDDDTFPDRFEAALRPGAYLRVIDRGTIQVGDAVTVHDVPPHGVTIEDVSYAETTRDAETLERLLTVDQLPPRRREVATKLLERLRAETT